MILDMTTVPKRPPAKYLIPFASKAKEYYDALDYLAKVVFTIILNSTLNIENIKELKRQAGAYYRVAYLCLTPLLPALATALSRATIPQLNFFGSIIFGVEIYKNQIKWR